MSDDKKVIFSMVKVSKTFPPQKQVLKDIYLSFFYGAKIGIIGLNGSGKSTLLNAIAGSIRTMQARVKSNWQAELLRTMPCTSERSKLPEFFSSLPTELRLNCL